MSNEWVKSLRHQRVVKLMVGMSIVGLAIGCDGGKRGVGPRVTPRPTTGVVSPAAQSPTETIKTMVARVGELVGPSDRVISSRRLEDYFDVVLPRQFLRSNASRKVEQGTRLWLLDAADSPAARSLASLKWEVRNDEWIAPGYMLRSYLVESAPQPVLLPGGDFEGPVDQFLEMRAIDYNSTETEKWWGSGQVVVTDRPDPADGQCLSLTYTDRIPAAVSPMMTLKGPSLCFAELGWRGDPMRRFTPSNVFSLTLYEEHESGQRDSTRGFRPHAHIEPTAASFEEGKWNDLTLLWVLPETCCGARLVVTLNYPDPPGNSILIDDVNVFAIAP